MTPQEENIRLQQQVNEELRIYNEAQRKATAETEKAAEVEAKVANLTATGLQIMEKLYNAQLKYTLSMAKGEKGASQFNDGIDAMTEAAQIAAVALSLLVPGGPLIKGVVAGLTFLGTQALKTAAEMQKAANDQADATYKAFQAFSKAGATGADGLKGFFDDVNRMRLNVRQMDAMAQAIGSNAKELTAMGGTVYRGRKEFANLVEGLGDFEQGMLNLGMQHDEQAEAVLGYMKIQSNITRGQQQDYGKLNKAARAFIEETEVMTRVTGLNRKQQEEVLDRQMSSQRSGARLQELANEGNTEAVKLLQQQVRVYAKMGPQAEQGYNDILSGNVNTAAAIKLMTATQGKVMQDQNDIIEKRVTTDREAMAATQGTAKVMGEMQTDMLGLFKAGVGEEILGPFKELTEANKIAAGNLEEAVEDAKNEVDKLTGNVDGADSQLTRYTSLIQKQNDEMLDLQRKLNGAFSETGMGLGTLTDLFKKAGDIFMELSTVALNKMREILGIEGPTSERLETERQDELNTSQATMGEAVAMAPAKVIEAAGDIAALGVGIVSKDAGKAIQNVVDDAKKERVASDTEYLKQKPAAAALKQQLGFGPGMKAPITAADYQELERQRRSPAPAAPATAPAPGGKSPSTPAPAPAPATAPTTAPTTPPNVASQQDLAKLGLKIKKGDVQSPGSTLSSELIELAKKIQGSVPGFQYFSGFNDRYHQEESPTSLHTQGMAADFVLGTKPSKQEGKKLVDLLKSLGATQAIDEYNKPSAKATGGHIHVEVAKMPGQGVQAEKGGVFDGPKSGYAATLHGPEAVIPLKDGAVPVSMSQEFNMTATNLGELVNQMRGNMAIQDRMLAVLEEMRRSQATTADNTSRMAAVASN
jgi:hypothetical protein